MIINNAVVEIMSNKSNIDYTNGAFLINSNGFKIVNCSRLKLVLEKWNKCVMSDTFDSIIEEMLIDKRFNKAINYFVSINYI